MPMEGLKRRLSFRKKKKDKVPECSKPHQWQEDEKKVREGTCSFQVRYLGCVEVFESRGMQVCEEAVKTLKAHCKGKYQRAILYVSGDALRVVDEINKSMIVDQTIEKVSFCAPDRNHEKGFAYICRDGTTRRWMCHGFLAVKESRFWRTTKIKRKTKGNDTDGPIVTQQGERLSHAVGCAFAICLERKQKRDKESNVTVTYSQDRTCFERTGSFRQTTMTERLTDPQSAIVADPVPVRTVDNPHALQRPHATQNMLVRQGSFRGFSKLQETTSPFKRTLSLRLNDLPSTLQRQNAVEFSPPKSAGLNNNGIIEEVPSPETEDSISQMCQQLTQGLTALNTKEPDDPFASAPLQHSHPSGPIKQHSMPATFHSPQQAMYVQHPAPPLRGTNPWSSPSPAQSVGASPKSNPTPPPPFSTNPFLSTAASVTTTTPPLSNGRMGAPTVAPHLQQHARSHSMDTSDFVPRPQASKAQTLLQMSQHQSLQLNGGNVWQKSDWPTNSSVQNSASSSVTVNQSVNKTSETDSFDPFDVAWAAKGDSNSTPETRQSSGTTNPFTTKTVTTYKMEL